MSGSLDWVISSGTDGRRNIWFGTSWLQKYAILVAVAVALQLVVPLDPVTAYDIALAPVTALIWLGVGGLIWQGYLRARGSEPDPVITKWARPVIVISTLILIGLLSGPEAAGGATGTALVLTVFWMIMKNSRPGWTSGWSGAWLFVSGLFMAWAIGINTTQSAVAIGFLFGTLIVGPPMIIWKIWAGVRVLGSGGGTKE